MEKNISIIIKFNNITENIKLIKDFDEFKNKLFEIFQFKEKDFENLLLYYIDEDNDKISIQNSTDYSQFYEFCKNDNHNDSNILYIKENIENNTNNKQYINKIIEKTLNFEEIRELPFEQKYNCNLLCVNCNTKINKEPFYYCPKCKEYACSNCDKFISSHRHVAYIIYNTNQYSDLIDSINNKNKKRKTNVFEKISNIIFSEKSDAEKIKMCKKIYNLDGVSDEKILDALNKSNGNPEKIIEYLF